MSWLDTLDDIRMKDFTNAPLGDRDKAARDVVNMASYACAVVAVSPIPFSDAVLSLPVQTAMVVTIGHIYGRKLTEADSKELVVELATTAGVGMLARQGIKALLPMVGALLTVPAAFAANWGIGRVAMEYFRHPGATKEQLKKVYEAAKEEGSSLFSKERFDAFRKAQKDKAAAKKAAKAESEAEEEAEGGDEDERSEVATLIEDDFAERIANHRDVRESINGVLHLDITGEGGGTWTIDFTKESDFVTEGFEGKAKMTIGSTADDFVALLTGHKSPRDALMKGELVLTPLDIDLAMKLGPLFKPAT
jgi:uncharacterized protein (DUF697 family)